MCPESGKRDANDETEASYIRKVAELEASLKGKTQLEETLKLSTKHNRKVECMATLFLS